MFSKRMNNQGMVFITAIAMVSIFFVMAIAYMKVLREESQININYISSIKAFYAAESGVAHSIGELRAKADNDGDTVVGQITTGADLNGDAVGDYTVTWNSGLETIESTAVIDNAIRSVVFKITYDNLPDPANVTGVTWIGYDDTP